MKTVVALVAAVLAVVWPRPVLWPDGAVPIKPDPRPAGLSRAGSNWLHEVTAGAVAAAAASVGLRGDGMVIDFGPVSPAEGPKVARRVVQLAIESDEPWQLTLAAAGDFVTSVPGFRPVPAERLQWGVEDGSDPVWQPLALDPVVVAAGPGGDGPALVALSFRLDVGWDAQAATMPYQAALVFTVAPGGVLTASFAQPLPGGQDQAPSCLIGYWVPGEGMATVRIWIGDATGEPLREAVVQQVAGRWQTWEWDGRDNAGQPLDPGLYYYTVTNDDGRILAAGACAPPDGATTGSGELQVQTLASVEVDAPAIRLEATVDPERVSGGDWLRLDWALVNGGTNTLHPVHLAIDLPEGWRPVGPADGPVLDGGPADLHGAAAGTRRWMIPVDPLQPGTATHGRLWVAVAPGAQPGIYRLRVAAAGEASGQQVRESTSVAVMVSPGPFGSGQLVAKLVFTDAVSGGGETRPPTMGIAFQVLGGPRLGVDAAGVVSWAGLPGLYLLVPDPDTLPPGWWAPAVPFRLTAGTITYVEVPVAWVGDAEPETRVYGALAVETDSAGTQLAAQLRSRDGTSELWLRRGHPFEDGGVEPPLAPELARGEVLLPLGVPWAGSPESYVGGRRRWDSNDWVHVDLMTSGALAPRRGLHVMRRSPAGVSGVMWVRSEHLFEAAEALGAYWQRDVGSLRVALQGLWGTDRTTSAMAWGAAAIVPLGDRIRLEGAYRLVPPQPPVPWLPDGLPPGWSVGLRWHPVGQSEWQAVVGLHDNAGATIELAGRMGNWQLYQRMLQAGKWRPATRLSVALPGSGVRLGVETGPEAPMQWQLGGGGETWTWTVEADGGSVGRARLGWQGPGPLRAHWRLEAAWHFGGNAAAAVGGGELGAGAPGKPGTLTTGLDWRLRWDKLSAGGHGWHGELVWQPSDPEQSAAVSVGRRLEPVPGRWTAWELGWERAAAGEAWQAGISGRRPTRAGGELTGHLQWRRAWREGAGGLHTGQLSLLGQQPLSERWHGLLGVRWWVQWLEGGSAAAAGMVLDLGLARDLGAGWRLAAGWRVPWGAGSEDTGPYVRLEWQPLGPPVQPLETGGRILVGW